MSDPAALPRTRILASHMVASLSLFREPWEDNVKHRIFARSLAQDTGNVLLEYVTVANLLAALIELGNLDDASELVPELDTVCRRVDKKERRSPEFLEVRGAELTHRGKIAYWLGRSGKVALEEAYQNGNQLYADALRIDPTNDHRRTNRQTEWAEQLVFMGHLVDGALAHAEEILGEALQSLNTHPCVPCKAYFELVQARLNVSRSALTRIARRPASGRYLSEAEVCARTSVATLESIAHPAAARPRELLAYIESQMEIFVRPRRIFLSHSGADKPLVREFARLLRELEFDPWLDEDAMAAGTNLERGLRAGFRDSCAAVFFITPSFRDENYLATEIDYAISEKREKKDKFAIVTLVLPSGAEDAAPVPELLRPYVWKRPANLLEAVRELVRALPLAPGAPVWKDEDLNPTPLSHA